MHTSKTRKSTAVLLFIVLLIIALSGCSCQHKWKNWEEDGENMKRICSKCQVTEIQPLDWNILVNQNLVGNWQTVSAGNYFSDEEYGPDSTECKESQCVFFDDNTCSLTLFGDSYVGNWEVMTIQEDIGTVLILVNEANGGRLLIRFQTSSPLIYIDVNIDNEFYCFKLHKLSN